MWGGATRVPGPKELEGLTGTSLPLNGAPMGTTPLGFLMRWDKRVAVATDYPHQHLSPLPYLSHLFSFLIMPISGNTFAAIGGHGTITKYDHHAHQHSRIEFRDPYPSTADIVARMSREGAERDDLGPCYHSNALFGFAVRAHHAQIIQISQPVKRSVLRRLLNMGIYDWHDTDRSGGGGHAPSLPIRYAAMVGHELVVRIEAAESRVSVAAFQRDLSVDAVLCRLTKRRSWCASKGRRSLGWKVGSPPWSWRWPRSHKRHGT